MRHLSVPKRQTQFFIDALKKMDWFPTGYRVLSDGECSLVPIAESAPRELSPQFTGIPIVIETQDPPSPKTWIAHLPNYISTSVIDEYEGIWPNSQEHYSDIILFKIEREIEQYAQQVALAKMDHSPKTRLILRDHGVSGEFRVRMLEPLAARSEGAILNAEEIISLPEEIKARLTSTRVSVKENGTTILLDPSTAYYSSRLAGERERTVSSAMELRNLLSRPLSIADPYCGVGPAVLQLLNQEHLVGDLLACDINPHAVGLLRENIGDISENWFIGVEDATTLGNIAELLNRFDFVLMNLPHETLAHLPHLLPLLKTSNPTILRGWAVVEEQNLLNFENELNETLIQHAPLVERVQASIRRQYNATKVLVRFEARYGDW